MNKDTTNLSTRKLTEFTEEDTIYMKDSDIKIGSSLLLCRFVSYDAKKMLVYGQASSGKLIGAKYSNCALYGSAAEDVRPFYHWFDATLRALHPMEQYKMVGSELHVPKHPAYGLLGFSRRSGGHSSLFGSSIQHTQTITMTVSRAEHKRELNNDWYHGKEELIEVEMSQSQFAEAITSMNMGSGIPCTIRYVNSERMPNPPYNSKVDLFQDEFKNRMHNLMVELDKLVQASTDILENKPSISKGDRAVILKQINRLRSEISGNIPYMGQQFIEQMDKTITEAKGEIEAFVTHRVQSAGIKALNREDFPVLNTGEGKDNGHDAS